MIGVIDYGLGNVEAFLNVYHRLHIPAKRLMDPKTFDEVDRLILPGVGSFDWAMQRLSNSGLKEKLSDSVMVEQKPVLGICVGMQMLARRSSEGVSEGLGLVDTEVKDFHTVVDGNKHPVPHMGWNTIESVDKSGLFTDLDLDNRFYFLHSYFFPLETDECLATAEYGIKFACGIRQGNAFGVQFHPEKSHECGMKLLKNFATEKL